MQPFTFFVSYRREDTAPIALLLKNEIEKRLQFVRVVVDVDEMQAGEGFPERLQQLIRESHATIVLIGKRWIPRIDEGGPERVAPDWVTEEIKCSFSAGFVMQGADRYGLKRRVIIPIFVDCDRRFDQFVLPEQIAKIGALQAERIDYSGWPSAIGPLIERIAVRLSLKKRPDADEYPKPDPAKARTQMLPDAELTKILNYDDYNGWYVDNFGNPEARYLVKTFRFENFDKAAKFMDVVANQCRVLDHHPEWRNVYNHVSVSLTTWDARRGVTIYDLNLALYMNMAAKALAKNS